MFKMLTREKPYQHSVNAEKMTDEHTPLITTVRVGQVRRRYPHNTLRRFCTIALSSTLVCVLFTFLLTVVFAPHRLRRHRDSQWSWPGCEDRKLSYEGLKEVLLDTPDSKKAEEWSKYYTSGAHLAGQNYSQVRGQE
jgi:N-acetylated-alpha-linked acidic dipeptidase